MQNLIKELQKIAEKLEHFDNADTEKIIESRALVIRAVEKLKGVKNVRDRVCRKERIW